MTHEQRMEAPHTSGATGVLLVEASATRRHMLRRVLARAAGQVFSCDTPAEALTALRASDAGQRIGAVVLALEAPPAPQTDALLTLLASPVAHERPVLLLTHASEPRLLDWSARRARSAVLLWEDFADSAELLARLMAPAGPAVSAGEAADTAPIRVLLVDDSRTVRASFRRLLAEQGYQVETAADAAEGFDKACAGAFDIAILDYFMPGENGDALCRRLRADPRTRGITSAILTGTYLDTVIRDSLKAGAVECMFKNEAQELFLARLAAMSRMVRTQKSVEAERSRLAGILASVGDGVYGVDCRGVITFMNPAARVILGLGDADIPVGASAHTLIHHTHEDGTPNAPESCRLQQAYARGDALRGWGTVFWKKCGNAVPVECTVFPLRIDGRLEGSVVAFRDVSERRALEQELTWQANHDPLTRLYNRHCFEKRLEEEVARVRRGRETSALLYLDLDRFKYINDTAGHAAGDQLLIELSQQLRERLRETDLLARLGGDEFAIILRQLAPDQVHRVAEGFREILERYTFVFGGQPYRVHGSIGVALIDHDTESAGEALANADIACHIAKSQGRNQTHVYQPASDEKLAMNVDLGWSTRLQEALHSDGFVLYFQPVVPIRGFTAATLPADIDAWGMRCMDGVVHCEALVRLPDVHGGVIAPGAFLPTAERFGLMPQIDLWVVRAAIARLARLNCAGMRACVAVNLSGHTLDQRGLAADVKHLLAESGVEPCALMFEITETNAIANLDAARRLIGELRELGCRFALDDFGSGFSSFHHLKHLPVDFVKIDGQFVRGMARDPADRAVVASINDIAHSFGKRTIAEFVESREILELLCECGVDYAQGYYLSPPRPIPTYGDGH